jgi:hypothetical protein
MIMIVDNFKRVQDMTQEELLEMNISNEEKAIFKNMPNFVC